MLPISKYAFLTLPNYSLIAVTNAVEPLRMANRVVGQDVYEWSIVSLDGRPVLASSGLDLAPTIALDKIGKVEILFVCGGINVREAVSAPLLSALRRLAERRVALGALCTGGYALARAGLLDNYRATIHWENLPALREEFPRVQLNDQVFSIDRERYTCSGGTAPLDLMLNLIQLKHGLRISQLVSEQFVLERVRSAEDRQYVPLARAGRRVASRHDQGGAADGGEHRKTAVARPDRARHRPIETADRAPVQAPPRLRAEEVLPRDAPAPCPRTAAADGHADHGRHDLLRLQVAAAFLPLLSQPVRPSAERGAVDPEIRGPAGAQGAAAGTRRRAGLKRCPSSRPACRLQTCGCRETASPCAAPRLTSCPLAGPEMAKMPESEEGEFDLRTLDDTELAEQVHDDLYNGLKAEVEQATHIFLERGWSPERVLNDGLVEGMRIVGVDFRDGILFVPEVLLAANAMKGGMEILRPLLAETGVEPIGKIVIGTVKGDIHDIGKNLVGMMLEGAGFEVIDLGINNAVEKYLAALEKHQPDFLGMSALLTTTMPYMKVVIDTLKEKNLRDKYIVLVGGAPLNEEFGKAVGADAYCRDAAIAVETAKRLIAERRAAAKAH